MGVQIFLFGRFTVCRDGHPLPTETWKNANTQALLKILASDRGRVFSADELIEYLWPDEELDLKSASSNLRNRVADLRKILEPTLSRGEQSHYILTQRGGYVLSAESDCWVDAEEFSRLEELGRRQQREGRLDEAIDAFEKAVALYRGHFLAEDRYDDWALQAQERWRERFVELLSLLADCLARRGQYRAAIHYLERALAESALHETLYRQLMIYAFCAGETARVHQAYEQCRAALERELGERPSSQTEEIYRQIRTGKIPDLERLYPESAPEQFLSSLPRKIQRPPFVGRQNEWRQLTSALHRARSGEGRIVLICGEAGVGKTRLSEEFLAWAQGKVGAQTLVGRSYELETPLPLHPWLEALREGIPRLNFADLADLQPSWVAELSEILPELKRAIPNLPAAISLPPEHRQYRLFETLYRIVGSLALRQAPIVFLLDDLQWADAGSLDFLCYIMERLAKEPLLILGTLRSEEVPREHHLERLRHQGSRFGRLDEVHLTRFGEQEVQDLVKSLADELETTADFGGRLYHESVGNPLFAAAVLQALFENGAFVSEGDRWRLASPSSVKLPSQAVGLIERRVTRVSAAAQRVLQLVACAVQIELEVLEEAWEGTPEELFVHLTELVAQGLLTERLGGYEFAHDKFREVVYESLEGPRRVWLHRRIAQALEQVYPDPAAAGFAGRLAQHYELGGQPLQALGWLLKAVHKCEVLYQNEEGLQCTAQGLRVLQTLAGRLPNEEYLSQEFEIFFAQIQFQMHLGELDQAGSGLRKLYDLATQLKDDHRKARLYCLHAQYSQWLGNYSESLKYARQAHELYNKIGTRVEQATGLYEVGLAFFYLGDYRQALKYYEQASLIFKNSKENRKLIDILDSLGNACTKLGECQKALSYYKRALDLCQAINDIKSESDLLNNRGVTLRTLGSYQEALEHFQKACATDEKVGNRLGLAFSLSNLGQAYCLLGVYNKALGYYQQAHKLFGEFKGVAEQGIMERLIGSLYLKQGKAELARTHFEAALRCSQTSSARAEEAECMRELGELALAQNESLGQAIKFIENALSISQELRLSLTIARSWVALSRIHFAEQRYQKALKACEEVIELFAEYEWGGELVIQAHYQHYRALQALDRPEAPDALRKAYDELQKTANQITDDHLRASFLSIPLHREILSAAQTPSSQPSNQKSS